ncbi:hypothetical protein [Microbacterium sp.]|uniref:hypothetical protein n=1 Tax=Microbacterium sp. TaxID=51671 RepID=UPI0028120F84|nr:hypothetical protein [Microbacterium sp.]
MFDEKFDEARQLLAQIQRDVDQYGITMNDANPLQGGPGLSPEELHRVLGYTVAGVHNLALVLGNIVDILDEQSHAG